MKKLKGVSPLVATIVLIALVLVIGGLVATFVQTTTTRQFQTISECTQAKGFIERASYNDAGDDLTIFINNNGKINLTFTSTVSFLNGSVQSGGSVQAPAGQITPHVINDITPDIQDVAVQSTTCVVVDVLNGSLIAGI